MTLQAPPKRVNKDGQTRCVGVEIEFAGLPPRETAELVRTLFGGELNVVSPHRLQVEGTRWGEFGIELDTQYAHPDKALLEEHHESDSEWARQQHQRRVEFHQKTRELIGDMVTGLVPTEIVCPPIPWDELETLDTLFETLREKGAKGTDASRGTDASSDAPKGTDGSSDATTAPIPSEARRVDVGFKEMLWRMVMALLALLFKSVSPEGFRQD